MCHNFVILNLVNTIMLEYFISYNISRVLKEDSKDEVQLME
jgi:predicted Na+-dependent transporter